MESASERLRALVTRGADQDALDGESATTLCREAIAVAAEVEDGRSAAEALCVLADAFLSFERKTEARFAARAALDRFTPSEPELWQAEAWTLLGAVSRREGRTADAAAGAEQAIAIARHVGSRSMEGTARNNLGLLRSSLGEYEEALSHYLEALAALESVDTDEGTRLRLLLFANVADLHVECSDHLRAAEHLASALELARQTGWRMMILRLGRKRAVALRHAGCRTEALAQLGEILPLAREGGMTGGLTDQILAEAAVQAGDKAKAAYHYRAANRAELPLATPRRRARLGLDLAAVLDPRSEEGFRLARAAVACAEGEVGCDALKCDALELLSTQHEARGELADALGCARAAATLHRSLLDQARQRQQSELQARFDVARRSFEASWHRSQNEELTRRVDERTRELQAANRDLLIARDRAEAADRMKTGFLTAASHELRTPLNAIIGYGELIREELGEGEPQDVAASAERLLEAADRLLQVVDRILQTTNLEAGATHIRPAPVSMPALLADIARSVTRGRAARENTLDWTCPDDLGAPHTDPTLLRAVLFNLVENADKFTHRGRVTVRVRREGPLLVVAVADTGIGMNAAEVARLFQPFTQLESGFTRRFGGLGLGLALARRYCALLGGALAVQSEAGAGSVFEVRVPFDLDPAP